MRGLPGWPHWQSSRCSRDSKPELRGPIGNPQDNLVDGWLGGNPKVVDGSAAMTMVGAQRLPRVAAVPGGSPEDPNLNKDNVSGFCSGGPTLASVGRAAGSVLASAGLRVPRGWQ